MKDQNLYGLHKLIVQRMSPRCANSECRHPIDLSEVVTELFDRIAEHLADGEEVRIHGFGTLSVRYNAGRAITSVATGKTIQTRGMRRVIFKAHPPLKKRLNPEPASEPKGKRA